MDIRIPGQKELLKHNENDCMYSPVKPNTLQLINDTISIVSPHEYCNHTHYCIFNKNRIKLESDILNLEHKINEFENIKNAAINGEIIYHEDLEDYYDLSISPYTGIDGKTHYKTDAKLKDNFMNAVNLKIRNLRYDLRGLLDFRLDVLHGEVDGYGYFEC